MAKKAATRKRATKKKKTSKRPGKRTTRARSGRPAKGEEWQTDANVGTVASLLCQGYAKGKIKDVLAALHSDRPRPSARTYESLFKAARALILDQVTEEPEYTRACAISWYRRLIQDQHVKDAVKVRCQERIDQILGHEFEQWGGSGDVEEIVIGEDESSARAQLRVLIQRKQGK